MPPIPQWFQRLPEIVEELSALEAPVVDRATLEQVFGLSRRATINLMHRFGGYQAGKTFLVDRQPLIERLRSIVKGEDYDYEQKRKERLVEILAKLRRQRAGAQVSIPVEPDVFSRKLADLPEGVSLEPGELRITFTGAEDLLQKLFELGQAISNDFEQFRKVVEA